MFRIINIAYFQRNCKGLRGAFLPFGTFWGAFIDKAMTGTNGNRPAFQKMLSDSERSDAFEIVLVYAIDRFKIHGTRRFIVVSKKRLRYGSKRAV